MKRSVVVTIATLTILAGTCVAGRQHDKSLWTNAERVRPGMSVPQVEQILGAPSWQDRCEAKFPYGSEKSCVGELGSRCASAPFPPIYVVVQLDPRGRVIRIDTINSP